MDAPKVAGSASATNPRVSTTGPPERRPVSLRTTVWLVLAAVLPSAPGLVSFFVGDDFDFLVIMRRTRSAAESLELTFWGEWEPLWYLGFYFDYRVWGLNPVGYHLSSLLWLVLGVLVLYALVRELWPQARLAPWAAALLFATHPLHDEAVTYLAARGHPMSAALALLSLWLYARSRRPQGPTGGGRAGLLAASLLAALLAASAKETALLLPVWIAMLEFCVFGRARWSWAVIGRTLRSSLLFLVPAAGYLGLRYAVVGLDSGKLAGPDQPLSDLIESFSWYLPDYALIGGVPLPFAFVRREVVELATPLGWVVVAAALLLPGFWIVRQLRRDGQVSRGLGIYALGVAIVAISLVPVFWADLGLRRRYFFVPSIGTALMAAVFFEWLALRRARLARGLLLVLVAGSALGLLQRNELYRRAGQVTLSLVESVRGAPLGEPAPRDRGRKERRIVLLTLPRYWGGDGLSGAYLMHRTDARSAIRVAGVEPKGFSVALQCYFAEDYAADLHSDDERYVDLDVSFRTRRAYESSRDRIPGEDRVGRFARVLPQAGDEAQRTLRYRVFLSPQFTRDSAAELYLYSDGRFRRQRRRIP